MQDQRKIATLVLKYLIDRYTHDNGSKPYEISGIIKQQNADAIEIADYLKQRVLIKNVTFLPGGEIHAEIAPNGLREADTGFVAHYISKVIAALKINKNQPVSLLEVTEIPDKEFSVAFDIMEIMKIDDFYEINPSMTRRDFNIIFNQRGYSQFMR